MGSFLSLVTLRTNSSIKKKQGKGKKHVHCGLLFLSRHAVWKLPVLSTLTPGPQTQQDMKSPSANWSRRTSAQL